jgi:hypothetical protein
MMNCEIPECLARSGVVLEKKSNRYLCIKHFNEAIGHEPSKVTPEEGEKAVKELKKKYRIN